MKNLADPKAASEIRNRILSLTPSDAPQWGMMTGNQMVCHVRQAFVLALEDTPVKLIKSPLPPRALKFAALTLPRHWPHSIPTPRPLRIDAPGMECTTFEQDRASLLAALDNFCALTDYTRDHPLFGAMKHGDWMRWGYLHADHHLRQFNR
jgi:hypothetical protein